MCFINSIPKYLFTAGRRAIFLGEMSLFTCTEDEGKGRLSLIFNYASSHEDVWGNGSQTLEFTSALGGD